MSEEGIMITAEEMGCIARYEYGFDRYLTSFDEDEERLVFPDSYRMTIGDLKQALLNILEKNPTVGDFGDYWYYPLSQLEDTFGITEQREAETDGIFLVNEADYFCYIWRELEEFWSENDDEDTVSVFEYELKRLLSDIEEYERNKDIPVALRTFSVNRMEDYICIFEDDDRVANASEEELALCRSFTEKLCETDNITALHLKGYACYGGNRLYPCDWKTSRDCIKKLYKLTDDPNYANTLGYISYYGRCNGGVPEYEEAFGYFSIAAANGLHEGLYKLADMFRNGYACAKSPATARALYGMVYVDCLKQFMDGHEGSFADAALRIGNVFLRGIGEEENPETALRYFLQADYALKRRMKNNDFFGNDTVAVNLSKSLEEVKGKLGNGFFGEAVSFNEPWLLYQLFENGNRVKVSLENGKDGYTVISAERVPIKKGLKVKPILVEMPSLLYCEKRTGISYLAKDVTASVYTKGSASFRYDYCEWNWSEQRVDFYNDDVQVAWIKCGEYFFVGPEKEEPHGSTVRLVSIAFQPGGRTYDYVCDLPDVSVGDKVIVPGYDGETEVTVTDVFEKVESELPIPLERYKKVIRKAK